MHSIEADVALSIDRIVREHLALRNKSAAIGRPASLDRKFAEIWWLDDLL
jgi:hypothetical protein